MQFFLSTPVLMDPRTQRFARTCHFSRGGRVSRIVSLGAAVAADRAVLRFCYQLPSGAAAKKEISGWNYLHQMLRRDSAYRAGAV